MESKLFYRIGNIENEEGLWYTTDGKFTGHIHNKFKFCKASELPMPFDPDVVGWLSTTDKLSELFNWFSKEEIAKLETFGYKLSVYEATEYREYENHWLIKQDSSEIKVNIPVESL